MQFENTSPIILQYIPVKYNCSKCEHEGVSRISGPDNLRCTIHDRKCLEPDCPSSASYGYGRSISIYPFYCSIHGAKYGLKNITLKLCAEPGCEHSGAKFNFIGQTRGLYCSTHGVPKGMVNVVNPGCLTPGCPVKKTTYGKAGTRTPTHCATHGKLIGLIDVTRQKCQDEQCKERAFYAKDAESSPTYCIIHKPNGFIRVHKKTCKNENPKCRRTPIFNFPGQKGKYCFIHKLPDMIDVVNKQCAHNDPIKCTARATHNKDGEKTGLYCCFHGRKLGMRSATAAKCADPGCKIQPIYGLLNQKLRRYCFKHKQPGMIDIANINKMCKQCKETRGLSKYNYHCAYCFINLFPNHPRVRNHKTKERTVLEFIKNHFPHATIISDKRVADGCSTRRPDILIDLGFIVLIVEVDENAHRGYISRCETAKINDTFTDCGFRQTVLLRFNTDSYIDMQGNKIKSPWTPHKTNGILMLRDNNEWNKRLEKLVERMSYWMKEENKPKEMLEIEYFYYNEDEEDFEDIGEEDSDEESEEEIDDEEYENEEIERNEEEISDITTQTSNISIGKEEIPF